jgi:hypothetical protein
MEYTKYEADIFHSYTTEVRLLVSSLVYTSELRLKCSVDTYKFKQEMNVRLT